MCDDLRKRDNNSKPAREVKAAVSVSTDGVASPDFRERLLYPNYRNYIYPVSELGVQRFLLFNPEIHYWISLNGSGAEIVRAFDEPCSLSELQNRLREQYELTEAEFEQTVVPFVNMLLSDRFLTTGAVADHDSWRLQRPSLLTPEDYPFDDIIISLSDNCNLACPYCFNQNQRRERLQRNDVRRLERSDVTRVVAEFKEMGGQGVIITGGEPTLNPEFLDICEDAAAIGLAVKVITNGTQLRQLDAGRLAEAVQTIAVSLDSADDSVNAILCGVNKYRVHDHILGPLAEIGRRRRRDGNQVRITIKPTITRLNLNSLPELARHIGRTLDGCNVHFDITGYHAIGSPETDAELSVSREQLEESLAAFAKVVGYTDTEAGAFGLSLAGKLGGIQRPRVLSCIPSLFVTNTGDVYPCQKLENSEFFLGSVFESSLRDAFSRPCFVALRNVMSRDDIETCRDCEFRYVCVEHCHGCAHKSAGRTTAFTQPSELACRSRMVRWLWLETQRQIRQSGAAS
ncbi:MAG: PqqD family peptide modification chaperone [Candidatus Brocadiaceae bacterium]